MPLITRIIRNGEPLSLRWGDFHVAAMALAACFDSGSWPELDSPSKIYDAEPGTFDCYPDAAFPITRAIAFHLCSYPVLGRTALNDGPYTLTKRHRFIDEEDGEVLELLPGDVLLAVRGW